VIERLSLFCFILIFVALVTSDRSILSLFFFFLLFVLIFLAVVVIEILAQHFSQTCHQTQMGETAQQQQQQLFAFSFSSYCW
jgi:exopolysaccharide biosynthesis protein